MAPLTPDWEQPSHPTIQKVIYGTNASQEFTSKSLSTIDLPPFALYAKISFPPCTFAPIATYATVQCEKEKHLNLNSDLVYINHSCEPSVIFEMSTLSILAGPSGLKAGQELSFFYPSTEWNMAQGFDCLCGTQSCKGFISGAKDMKDAQLAGIYLNGHIRELIEERDAQKNGSANGRIKNGKKEDIVGDEVDKALNASIKQAELSLSLGKWALETYRSQQAIASVKNGVGSRELSGEMGGDTVLPTASYESLDEA
ncbi:hypothetical protein BJ875DRAFT_441784 [Amylocarpus encephaloides]|uniref:Post-SET domain-containing protein n=1 Tax=Amylocarpus encephaloides TaxID=45428 RepID=A0A9P7YHA1_9HELO|nr:hypothetical protein BJ875DRAFT_441784 [Amylocarpus encephaloides]